MNAFVLAWIVTYLLHSTLLVLGAWLLDLRWRDRPERMSAVWKTALVGGVLTATLQTGLGVAPLAGHWELPSPVAAMEAVDAGEVVAASSAAAVVVSSRPALAKAAGDGAMSSSRPAPAKATVDGGMSSSRPAPAKATGDDAALGGTVLDVAALDVAAVKGPSGSVMAQAPSDDASHGSAVEASSRGVAPTEPALDGGVVARAVVMTEPSSSAVALAGPMPSRLPPGEAAPAPSQGLDVSRWLVGALLLGAALGLVSVLAAFVALHRQLRGRRPLSSGPMPALLQRLRRRAGVEHHVPLTVAPRVRVPLAVGVVRPEIVLPLQATAGLSLAHQQSLLAHELAHVLRRDPAWRVIALLVERVLFFQPLNRLASARLAQTAEYLCDDWAARHTQQPLALARCLTEIATWVARPGPVAATMAGPRSILGRRVHRLLQPVGERARPPWLAAALGLPLVALVLAAPGATAQAHGHGSKRHRGEPPAEATVVVVDDEGRRHALVAGPRGVVVVGDGDELGELHAAVEPASAPEAEPKDRAGRREARKTERRRDRAADDARRKAKKDLRRAFREARRRGDVAPSRREVEAILRRAQRAAQLAPEGAPAEHYELHVVVPGELEVHGRVPIEVETLRQLEALEPMLEQLELELEPMLEDLERALDDAEVQVHVRPWPGAHGRAQADAARARADAARARAEAARAGARHGHTQAQAWHDAVRQQQREAARVQREHEHRAREHERREAERIQRQLEQHERRSRHPRSRSPAPEPPLVWRAPSSARTGRIAPVVPTMPPAAPAAPDSPAPSVIWVSAPARPAPPSLPADHT
ncbi:MAG: hypothetical protein KDK70_08035 [Myxococcales bacterium]|nr:hypothetical protein [Myxococcales bacterium]